MNQIHKQISCNYCNSPKETISNGFLVCTSCGTIKDREYVDTKASLSKDGKYHNNQNSIGKSIDFIGSLGSQIGYSTGIYRSASGTRLKPSIISKYNRLKNNYHERARLKGNSTHLRTIVAFNRVFNTFEISKDIKHRALFLYWQKVNSGIKITNHILLIALCFLQSVRESADRAPVIFSEIISTFNKYGHRVTNKNILRLARELNIPLSPIRRKSEDYIERIASNIRLSDLVYARIQNKQIEIEKYEMLLVNISQKFLSLLSRRVRGGVQPYPFAVSIIYLADRVISKSLKSKPILTQQILANIAKSAEFTIRDHVYRFLGDLYHKYEDELIINCYKLISKV